METVTTDSITQEAQPGPQGEQHRSYALNRGLIIFSLILATALSALDGTIVATAMPTIVASLGGLPLYSLVIAVYLLTATTTVPLFGKLSDMYGRKPIFMIGAGIFVLGSLLCGLAWDMPSLIVFRGLQGLGGAAVVPVSLTLIGDLFSIEERARLSGVFSAVWGVSSVVGPLVGGAIVQFFNWRWVFFINVPVGIGAAALLFIYLREPATHNRQRVDVAGALTLTLGVAGLLIGLQSGGRSGWLAPDTLVPLAGAVVLLALFAFIEKRAVAPVLSLDLLTRPIISIPCLAGLLAGGVLVGFSAYSPLIIQGSWGGSPIEAGLLIAPLSIGWPVGSASSGRLLKRFGAYRPLAVGGTVIILLGCLLMMLIFLPWISEGPLLRALVVIIATFVAGLGFGFSTTSMLIAVQNSVPWSERGIATASVQFFRNMGNTVAAAVLGAVLTATLVPALATARMRTLLEQMPSSATAMDADPALGPVNVLFNLSLRDSIPHDLRAALADALSGSLGWVFLGTAIFALVGLILAVRFPRVALHTDD